LKLGLLFRYESRASECSLIFHGWEYHFVENGYLKNIRLMPLFFKNPTISSIWSAVSSVIIKSADSSKLLILPNSVMFSQHVSHKSVQETLAYDSLSWENIGNLISDNHDSDNLIRKSEFRGWERLVFSLILSNQIFFEKLIYSKRSAFSKGSHQVRAMIGNHLSLNSFIALSVFSLLKSYDSSHLSQ
jgi:hypothetical protein